MDAWPSAPAGLKGWTKLLDLEGHNANKANVRSLTGTVRARCADLGRLSRTRAHRGKRQVYSTRQLAARRDEVSAAARSASGSFSKRANMDGTIWVIVTP